MQQPAKTQYEPRVPRVKTGRTPAYRLRALGRRGLPPTIYIQGVAFTLAQTVKHDFFAATGFYDSPSGDRVVLKVGRVADYAGIPLMWLGKLLQRREVRFYKALADLPNIPPLLGTFGQTGFVHAYAQGRPLCKKTPVPDGFFDALDRLMAEVHKRGIAYVDTNKPQNIIVGEDGRPYLIDFQISYGRGELGNRLVFRKILEHLQREDLYHIRKHRRRCRPDELQSASVIPQPPASFLIRLHRWAFQPYFALRRRTFKRLKESGVLLAEGSK